MPGQTTPKNQPKEEWNNLSDSLVDLEAEMVQMKLRWATMQNKIDKVNEMARELYDSFNDHVKKENTEIPPIVAGVCARLSEYSARGIIDFKDFMYIILGVRYDENEDEDEDEDDKRWSVFKPSTVRAVRYDENEDDKKTETAI